MRLKNKGLVESAGGRTRIGTSLKFMRRTKYFPCAFCARKNLAHISLVTLCIFVCFYISSSDRSIQRKLKALQNASVPHSNMSVTNIRVGEKHPHSSELQWTRRLGYLSTASLEKIHQSILSQKKSKEKLQDFELTLHKTGGLPDDIVASIIHCRGDALRLVNGLLVVTSFDRSITHILPSYISMVSERSDSDVEILLMATGMSPEEAGRLCIFLEYQQVITPVHVLALSEDTLKAFFDYHHEKKGVLQHVPITTMSRLLLPSLMGDTADIALYLDLDIVLTRDFRINRDIIHQMCPEFDESESGICARESLRPNVRNWLDQSTKNALGLADVDKGFNAGVMVLNLTRMNAFGFSRYAAIISKYFGVNDQVILVAYAKNFGYSKMIKDFNVFYGQDPEDNGYILHFAGPRDKPWASPSKGFEIWSSYDYPPLLLVWSYFVHIPEEIIEMLLLHSRGRPTFVYCSCKACFEQVLSIGYPLIAQKIECMGDATPLKDFFSRLQIFKVVMGSSFPEVLNAALKLNILYRQGGLLLPSKSKMIRDIPDAYLSASSGYGFGESINGREFAIFSTAKDPHLLDLMERFMHRIENACLSQTSLQNAVSCTNLTFEGILKRNESTFCYEDYFEGELHRRMRKY